MPDDRPTTCDVCKTPLKGLPYVESYRERDGKPVRVGVVCGPCDDFRRFADYDSTRHLTTHLTVIAALKNLYDEYGRYEEAFLGEGELVRAAVADSERLRAAVKLFERAVWFGGHDPRAEGMTEPWREMGGTLDHQFHRYKDGTEPPEGSLQRFIVGETRSGHSASFTDESGVDIKLLSLAMCGRWRMTIQHPDGPFIDVITEENSCNSRMGLNGIGATADQAVSLIGSTMAAWARGDVNFTEDGDVHILWT